MAQRAISYNRLQQLCIDGVPVTVRRGEQVVPVFKIAGGAPEDDPSKGNEDPPKGPEGNEGEEGKEGEESSKPETVSRAEFESLASRMKAADKRASTAEARVKELEGEKQTELEKAQARVKELETENGTLKAGTRETQIRNAFLTENFVTWHDPDLAFREVLASLGPDVELDDNGKVPGLKEKVKALAKEKAWMVKTEAPGGPSGSDQNGKRKGDDGGQPDRAALAKLYPAIRR